MDPRLRLAFSTLRGLVIILVCLFAPTAWAVLSGHGEILGQPILVTQPRERVNSRVMEIAQLSRYEQASGSAGPVRVDFRFRPRRSTLRPPPWLT
jgi:hypothetical protein